MASLVRVSVLDACRFQKAHHYDQENIAAIAADLTDGSKAILNPIHVIAKGGGRWEIVAGHDRTEAAKLAGLSELPVRDFSATLFAAEKIYEHWRLDNVLRKQPDRMLAAEECLLDWAGAWSDRRVGTVCGVSHSTVAVIRKRLVGEKRLDESSTRVGSDERTYRPRQVRGNVPSGKTIPHPTAKVPSGAEQAGAAAPLAASNDSGHHEGAPGASEGSDPSVKKASPTNSDVGAAPARQESATDTAPESPHEESDGDSVSAPSLDGDAPVVPAVEITAGASEVSPAVVVGVVVPAWVGVALSLPRLAPLTEAEALAIPVDRGDALVALGASLMTAGKRVRVVHEKAQQENAA